jgi:predicted Zn-ribbon and HTH transcriptional regulator
MKRTIYYTGIGFALIFLVMELTYINAKSLLFLVAEDGLIDKIFAVIGALAFSMVTVLVMRTSSSMWMRIIFPLFDALLVFSGFNLKFADNLTANPVAFGLTIFLASFTGLIMYGLGTIGSKSAAGLQQTGINLQQPVASNNQPAATYQQPQIDIAAKLLQQLQPRQHTAPTQQQSSGKAAANGQQPAPILLHPAAATKKAAVIMQQINNEAEAESQQNNNELVQKLQHALEENRRELEILRAAQQKSLEARTCKKCGRVFETEASRRSHEGKCKAIESNKTKEL